MDAVAVGLSLRDPWVEGLLARGDRRAVDVLELMVDDALHDPERRRLWRRLGGRYPLLAHGVSLGIGDADGVDPAYVGCVAETLAHLHVRWYSEHLSFLRAGGRDLGHFAPVEDDPETLEVLARNGEVVRRACPCPLLLENPADILGLGAGGADAGRRLGRAFCSALAAAGAGGLVDVTNLLYNARNDGFDPHAFLAELDLARIVEVHVAGGRLVRGLWIDSHDRPLEEESLALLASVARRAPNLRAVVLEWDEDLPDLESALREVGRVREVLVAAGRR